MLGCDLAHAQDDVTAHILRMLEGIFSLYNAFLISGTILLSTAKG